MFNLENFLTVTNTINYDNVSENFMELTKQVVNSYFADKAMFKAENFKFYYYDDYVFNTNTSKTNYITLYVEINQPANIKAITDKKFERKVKDDKIKDLHLTLKEIKEGLINEFVQVFDSNTTLWLEKYSINISYNEEIDEKMVNYMLKVIPCFTYKNENDVEGVIYYNDELNAVEIEYPLISIKNIIDKDNSTNGLFYEYLIAFKNIFMQQKKVNNLEFEVFETILYNGPNEFFAERKKKTIMNILNILRNKNLKEYKTIDEQDFAYTSKYKSFSSLYAKHSISQIEKALKKLTVNNKN